MHWNQVRLFQDDDVFPRSQSIAKKKTVQTNNKSWQFKRMETESNYILKMQIQHKSGTQIIWSSSNDA